ncbi:MAG TPA: rod shape-determining protein [Anaerolineae bacterium]|nr:rod shape-determining protein [Anaerolineae bacterium]
MFSKQIGVDLGTVNVLVWTKGKGIVLFEPSIVALSTHDNRIVALGREAQAMLGRTPDSIAVLAPLRDGVIADYVVTELMLHYFISGIVGRVRLFKPEVMISVPIGVTTVEKRAVHDAAMQAGAKIAHLIPEPLAAALGAGMPIDTPSGNFIVDIGGGTSEAAVIAMNDIVVGGAVRTGGNKINDAIASYVRRKYNLMIGEQTAEETKLQIGAAMPLEEELTMEVRGRDVVAGLPRIVTLSSTEVAEAIAEPLAAIVSAVKGVLEKTPPELAADIIDRGVVMTGGGSLLRSLDRYLTQELGVPCYVADEAIAAVALGCGRAFEEYEVLKRTLPEL